MDTLFQAPLSAKNQVINHPRPIPDLLCGLPSLLLSLLLPDRPTGPSERPSVVLESIE